LADALREAGEFEKATVVEGRLKGSGSSADPRSCALYLATHGDDVPTALRLARTELETRGDIFTHDALAWALTAAGQCSEADSEMRRALAEGTQDPRLFLHAGVIAQRLGRHAEAERFLQQAQTFRQMLLPSEKSILADNLRTISMMPSPSAAKTLSQTEEANPQINETKNKQARNGRS
jgi:Flp pilus assembly protein TadD